MRRSDAGAAAVELALCLGLLLAVALLVAPLPIALVQQTRLEQAASYSARWASSVPGSTRPSVDQLDRIAETAFGGAVQPPTYSVVPQAQCATRKAVTVTLKATAGLGPLGLFAGTPSTDLTASASSCKE